jgi:hypothetical protein
LSPFITKTQTSIQTSKEDLDRCVAAHEVRNDKYRHAKPQADFQPSPLLAVIQGSFPFYPDTKNVDLQPSNFTEPGCAVIEKY